MTRSTSRWMASAVLTLVLFASSLFSSFAERGDVRVEFKGQGIDAMIAEYMREHKVPGMTLAIVQAPYITRVVGYGYSDLETKRLASTRTLFNIGDMEDAFAAVAILQLVESGKLKLDETLGTYSGHPRTATVRSLLLPSLDNPLKKRTVQDLLNKVSPYGYEGFIRRNQFERLGLKHTFFDEELKEVAAEELKPGQRHSQFLKKPELINPVEVADGYRADLTPVGGIADGIYSTAEDISAWDIGLAGEILIRDPELRKILYTPQKDKRSSPWNFPGRPGLMWISASAGGCSSFLSRFTHPDELLCVTLLANKEGLDLEPLARKIAAAFDAKLEKP